MTDVNQCKRNYFQSFALCERFDISQTWYKYHNQLLFVFHSAFLYHLQSCICITIPHPHIWEVQTNDSGCQSAGLPAAPSARSDKSYRLSGTSPPQLCTIMHQCTPMHCIISMHCNTKDYSALYSSHFILFALYCTSFHITICTVQWNQNADISLVCTVLHAHFKSA